MKGFPPMGGEGLVDCEIGNSPAPAMRPIFTHPSWRRANRCSSFSWRYRRRPKCVPYRDIVGLSERIVVRWRSLRAHAVSGSNFLVQGGSSLFRPWRREEENAQEAVCQSQEEGDTSREGGLEATACCKGRLEDRPEGVRQPPGKTVGGEVWPGRCAMVEAVPARVKGGRAGGGSPDGGVGQARIG